MTRSRGAIAAVAVAAFAAAIPGRAVAQGFGVYEQSACTMGVAGAGVAAPCEDGSAVFFNPAALALQPGAASLGGTFIAPRGNFVDNRSGLQSDLLDRTYPVPAVYFSKPIGRVALAIGLNAPYGLSTEWDEDTSQGRFLGYKSKVEGIYVQPTVAFKVSDQFALGFGVDIGITRVELRQRLDLSTQALPGAPPGLTFALLGVPQGTDFGNVRLEGDSMQVGFHLGALVKASDTVSIGARYLSRQKSEIEGDIDTEQILTNFRLPISIGGLPAGFPVDQLLAAQFQAGALLGDQTATTELYMPDQFVVGVAVQATPRLQLLGDYQFVNWSLFDELEIEGAVLHQTLVQDFESTSGIRIGANFAATPRVTIRGGFLTHQAAAPDQTVTPNLPEGQRNEYTVGVGFGLTESIRFDVAYQYIQQSDCDGRTGNCGVEAPTATCNNGTYAFHANLLGAGFSMRF